MAVLPPYDGAVPREWAALVQALPRTATLLLQGWPGDGLEWPILAARGPRLRDGRVVSFRATVEPLVRAGLIRRDESAAVTRFYLTEKGHALRVVLSRGAGL